VLTTSSGRMSATAQQEDTLVSQSRRRALVASLVIAPGVALATSMVAVDAHAAPATGTVYLVQGVADTPMTITVDGKSVASGAGA
jgi:hypothetical protein